MKKIKRLVSLVLALTMCLSLLPGIALAADSYKKVSSLSDVTSGGQFVLVANGLAMDTTLQGNKKFNGIAVTPSNGTLSGSLPVWTIETVEGGIAISCNGQYLAYDSSTNFKMQDDAYTWTVSVGNDGFMIKSKASTSRGIFLQTGTNRFGAYSTSNTSGYVLGLELYKLDDGTTCDHDYKCTVIATVSCTKDGEESYTCTKCNDTFTKTIAAYGHHYSFGTCRNCGGKIATDPAVIIPDAYALESGVSLDYASILTGKIVSIDEAYSPLYNNITLTIAVDGYEEYPIQCYRLKGTGIDTLLEGDVISVFGSIKNYKGKVEFDTGCTLVVTAPTAPTDPAQILADAYALEQGAELPYEAILTGKITSIDEAYSYTYKNITVTMVVAGCEDKPLVCYRMKGEGIENLKVGDIITVAGSIKNYKGKVEFNIPTLMAQPAHSYNAVVTAPTCTEAGYTTYTCFCGDSYVADEVAALGHNYETVTVNATCTTDGYKTNICTICGESGTQILTATGHSFTYYVYNGNGNCIADGTMTAQCDYCEETDTKVAVGTAGHTFSDYVSNNDATCTMDGTKTATCKFCGAQLTVWDYGTAVGHVFTNYIYNENATCTADGTKTAICDRCDVKDTQVAVGSKGHKDDNMDCWCDLCGCWVEHECFSNDGDIWCDLCGWTLEHSCCDIDINYFCDLCDCWIEHECISNDGDIWCDLCGGTMEHDCCDMDTDYYCDICRSWIAHECITNDGDIWCDLCGCAMEHDCCDMDTNYWCDLCGSSLPHDCLDEDSDYRCDICYDGIPHDCIDENNDYLCDLCASVLEHECADTDGDYLCDICDWWIPHDCVDPNGNYRCDICDDRLPHDCIDENVNYLCDYCNSVLDHPCFDENADYRCDVCFAFIDHDCIDEDNNYYCDLCACVMEHDCVDNDGDYNCDYCYRPIAHRCVDKNADYLCDLAGCWLYHDHVDHNGNFFCDICHYVMDHECVDEDRDCWCDIFGCQLESGWGPHATTDIDGDNRCDLCCRMLEHDCYDMDNDELCDLCHQECSSEEEYLPGDISGDGKVNMGDVAKLYAHIKGTSILTDDTVLDRCDISGDGKVNMGDVAKLYAHIKGTSKLF